MPFSQSERCNRLVPAAQESAAKQQQQLAAAEKQQKDKMTLAETKAELDRLRTQLVTLQNERHDLFAQLKKVLSEEDERRRRQEYIRQQQQRDAL